MNDIQLMHQALRHAIYSAIANTETATFIFLPCLGGRMNPNS